MNSNYEPCHDEELVTLAQQGNPHAKEELVRRYMDVVSNFCKPKFVRAYKEELRGELWITFLELVMQYPVDTRTFREMVINRLYFKRFNYYKKQKEIQRREWSYEEWDQLGVQVYQQDMIEKLCYQDLMEILHPNGTERLVLESIHNGCHTRIDIAKEIGVCPQTVSKILKRFQMRIHKEQKRSIC